MKTQAEFDTIINNLPYSTPDPYDDPSDVFYRVLRAAVLCVSAAFVVAVAALIAAWWAT